MSLEVQEPGAMGCFTRIDDENVICPMNETLHKIKRKGRNNVYRSKEACRTCSNRCTYSKEAKEVSFADGTKYITAKMYGKNKMPINILPKGAALNPNNHSIHKKIAKKKIVLHLKCDPAKIHTRMCTVKHPFGTVKWYDGAHYVLCKGVEKVTAEIGLSFLAYNMKRAINMVGTSEIIKEIYA